MGNENLEQLLDLIAEHLIQSDLINTQDVEANQKFILNGQLQTGAGEGVLALFQKDIKANQEDLNSLTTINPGEEDEGVIPTLQHLADTVDFPTLNISSSLGGDGGVSIFLIGGGANFPDGGEDITNLLIGDGNPMNVSQFIPLSQKQSFVDVDKAEEFLDTNIFELLPQSDTRQSRIIRFFQELNALLPPNLPNFDQDDTPGVDRLPNGDWTGDLEYQQNNSISYAQDNQDGNIDEEDAFIHRLKSTANDANSSRTIEDIYRTIAPYLTDIIEIQTPPRDDRPEYENQSSGYLQFRNPNQGIIIRNTNQDFVESLNPNNPTWLTSDYQGLLNSNDKLNFIYENSGTGFTITMWVRFLDKVSSGTLFNFGNPIRMDNAFGFRLETFVLNKDDTYNDGNGNVETFGEYIGDATELFKNTNTERFVRLQVREFDNRMTSQFGDDVGLRDSALGAYGINKFKYNPPDLNKDSNGNYFSNDERRLLTYTNIPEDFNEWYFICATYNPNVNEEGSDFDNTNPNYWLNHIEDGDFTNFSGLGNRCKVEIISRTDLLRARGFKV